MTVVEDFANTLREALTEVEAAGLVEPAAAARRQCFCACTTSSEWLGEVGGALSALLRDHGASLPRTIQAKLRFCLGEVAKATVTVITETGERWNVAPHFLHSVVESGTAQEGEPNVVPFRKK